MSEQSLTQVDINREIYIRDLHEDAERDHTGEAALMVDGKIIDLYLMEAQPTHTATPNMDSATSRLSS